MRYGKIKKFDESFVVEKDFYVIERKYHRKRSHSKMTQKNEASESILRLENERSDIKTIPLGIEKISNLQVLNS